MLSKGVLGRMNIDPFVEKSEMPPQPKKLRIAYLSGPCDAPAVFAEWSEGKQADYFGTNYMAQFLQVSAELDAESFVITTLPGKYSVCRGGQFIFENRPLSSGLRGARYHFSFVPWFARLTLKIFQFRPDVIIVTANQAYWFLWFFLRWFDIPMIPSFHEVPWPKYAPRNWHSRVLWQLNRFLVLRYMKVMLVTSNDISRQLRDLLGEKSSSRIDFVRHFPTYSRSQFASVPPPTSSHRPPFRVFFIGRIETNKGVYDILRIALQLEATRRGSFHFDICGGGGELDALRRQIRELKLENVVSCHGYCDRGKLAALVGASHAWIAPTRSDYAAGFEMVCAEAILSSRPLITSAVCPALEDLQEASVEVQPDSIDQYRQAILKLGDEPNYYLDKYKACAALQEPFYNLKNSWASKMKEILDHYIV